jgi:hypothetical protein
MAPHLSAPLDVPASVIKYTNGTTAFRYSLYSLVCTFGSKSISEFQFLFNRAFGIAHHISAEIGTLLMLLQYLFVL